MGVPTSEVGYISAMPRREDHEVRQGHVWIKKKKNYSIRMRLHCCGPGSSVAIATDYGLDDPGSNPDGDVIFRPSRPALGPTQPPVKWVQSLSRRQRRPGRGLTPHPIYCRGPRKSRAIPVQAFVACKKGQAQGCMFRLNMISHHRT